jgi:carbon storage regulator
LRFSQSDACIVPPTPLALWHRADSDFLRAMRAKDVLVLSRKSGERILIGDKISVTVVKIGHGGVRIGIEAPPELAVVREELAEELNRTEQALASGQSQSIIE